MTKLPIRRHDFATAQFAGWLARNGAEVGVPTNPYEVVRYRAYDGPGKPGTHIVYAKENGLLTFTGSSQAHYAQFLNGGSLWSPDSFPLAARNLVNKHGGDAAKTVKTSKLAPARAALLKRDGPDCWFCGQPMGADMTIEHLVPKAQGGRNTIANYALAHKRCNNAAADMPLAEKIELRARMRVASVDTLPKGQDGEAGLVRSKGSAVPAEERGDAQTSPPPIKKGTNNES